MALKAVVVGLGSIGRRHARLLAEREDIDLSFCEPNGQMLEFAYKEAGHRPIFPSFEAVLEASPDLVRMNIYVLYPGTPVAARLIASGRLPADYWRDAETATTTRSGEAFNVTAMPLDELRAAVRRLDREAVLPRFARDFRTHNPPWAALRYFRVGALPRWLWRKLQ